MKIDERARAEITKKKRARFPRVWIDDAGDIKPLPYIIKGILDAQSVALVYGPSGSGKTFFTADLAAHVAAGMPWRGRRVRSGLVVYIAAEAGSSILRRFTAWRDRHISDTREDRIPLVALTRGANLLDEAETEALLAELREIAKDAGMPLALVVFDTLSRSIPGGDENSPQDMTRAISIADRIRDELRAATLFVHHSGKDAGKGARGHSALIAAADTSIGIADHIATIEKYRDGMSGESFGFRLDVVELGEDEDGDPITTCVLAPTDALTRCTEQRRLTGAAQIALKALCESIEEHGEPMPETSSIPGGVRAVTIERWRSQFRIRYGSDEIGDRAVRQAFKRARELLLSREVVRVSDPYAWLT